MNERDKKLKEIRWRHEKAIDVTYQAGFMCGEIEDVLEDIPVLLDIIARQNVEIEELLRDYRDWKDRAYALWEDRDRLLAEHKEKDAHIKALSRAIRRYAECKTCIHGNSVGQCTDENKCSYGKYDYQFDEARFRKDGGE